MNLKTLWIIKKITIQAKEITSDFYPFFHKKHATTRYDRIIANLQEKGIYSMTSNIDDMDINIGEKHARIIMKNGTSLDIHLHKKTLLYDDFLLDDEE